MKKIFQSNEDDYTVTLSDLREDVIDNTDDGVFVANTLRYLHLLFMLDQLEMNESFGWSNGHSIITYTRVETERFFESDQVEKAK